MKRLVLFFGVLCIFSASLFWCSAAAKGFDFSAESGAVSITNEGKQKRLLLSWDESLGTDGMQIFRSETGKRGSFEKIATVRGKRFYRDAGLQANQVYFYKLRPFRKTEDGYVFGAFESVCGSTRLTRAFLKKQLNGALKAAGQYMNTAMPFCGNGKTITRKVETDDGLVVAAFREVTGGSIHTTAKLKKYLRRFFSRDLVENFVGVYYCDVDGDLYMMDSRASDPSYYVLSETTLQNVRQHDAVVTFDALLQRPDFYQTEHSFAECLGAKAQPITRNPKTKRIVVDPDGTDWNLVLVNKQRELPEGFAPHTRQILNTGALLDERVAPYYEDMYRAAAQDGCYLSPLSAYRSYAYQNTLFQNSVSEYRRVYGYSIERAVEETAKQILYPGTSEHQLGFAVDVQGTGQWFARTKEYRWLLQHAQEYGFILRYTAKKQPITGIIPEPWHWRYVGTPWAEEIKDSGLCLEEYLALKGGLFLTERRRLRLILENGVWVMDDSPKDEHDWAYANYAYRKNAGV